MDSGNINENTTVTNNSIDPQQANNTQNRNSYVETGQNTTTIKNNQLKTRNITTANNDILSMQEIFLVEKLEDVEHNLAKLDDPELAEIEKLNIFFMLSSCVKPEYLQLVNIKKTETGYNLCIASYNPISINNKILISYLDSNVEQLSNFILDIISSKDSNDVDKLFSLFGLQPKDIEQLKDGKELEVFKDKTISIIINLIDFQITKKNLNVVNLATNNKMFNALFNESELLFILLSNNYSLAFSTAINSSSLCNKVNLEIKNFSQGYKYAIGKYSNNILIEAAYLGKKYLELLLENGAVVTQEIIEELFSLTKNKFQDIDPSLYFKILEHTSESVFNNLQLSPDKMYKIFSGGITNYTLFEYISIIESTELKKKYLILFCKLISKIDFNTINIKDQLNIKTISLNNIDFCSFLLTEEFNKYQYIIDKFLYDIMIVFIVNNLEQYNANICYILINKLQNITAEKKYEFFTKYHSVIFIQVVVTAMRTNNKILVEAAKKLYSNYLNLEQLQPLMSSDDFKVLFGDCNGNLDWEHLDASNFVFKSGKFAILMDYNLLLTILYNYNMDKPIDWSKCYFFENNKNISINKYGLEGLFSKHFILFDAGYKRNKNKIKLVNYIKILNLEEYTAEFITCLDKKNTTLDLSIEKHDQAILKKMAKFIDEKNSATVNTTSICTITRDHLAEIKAVLELEGNSDSDLAKILVCLSFIFVSYSSVSIFGNDSSSPASLRKYASALLQTAYNLDKNCVKDEESGIYDCTIWQNRILGTDVNSTCTGQLSAGMLQYIKNNYPQEIIKSVIPEAWI